MISPILSSVAEVVLCYLFYHLGRWLYRGWTDSLRNLPGPPSPSFLLGNFKDMATDAYLTKKWRAEFGPIFKFKGLFNTRQLHISDVEGLAHVVNSSVYQRTPSAKETTRAIIGNGILATDDEEHKRQRRILVSCISFGTIETNYIQDRAFGIAQIRAVNVIFAERAATALKLAKQNTASVRIDVYDWLRRLTLDAIVKAGESRNLPILLCTDGVCGSGFNYNFDALEASSKGNALNDAFHDLLHSPNAKSNQIFLGLQAKIPIMRLVPCPGRKALNKAHTTMFSIAEKIVSESKAAILAAEGEKALDDKRDLMSVLLKADVSTSVPESQRLTETEVIAQIPGFFAAGHETTSAATSWALYELSLRPDAQKKLRKELFTLATENPTMDELNTLPYLEKSEMRFVRCLRLSKSLARLEKSCGSIPRSLLLTGSTQDDVIPLSKPYIDKAGKSHEAVFIRKGEVVYIPIWTVNTDEEIWGVDAAEFKPERWENIPEAAKAIPGPWANILTFFAGSTKCIGFRFSLTEMKTLLFTLIRAFEFQPGVLAGRIGPASSFFQVPVVVNEAEKGAGLPLVLTAYVEE
ncbi:cytochrome P450 [Mycena galopus ATCC 62051]|nr:cytochrome P450 [Mycena galopus ATCC 62051]